MCVYHAAALLIHRVSEWSRKAALLLLSVRQWSFRDSRGKYRLKGLDSCRENTVMTLNSALTPTFLHLFYGARLGLLWLQKPPVRYLLMLDRLYRKKCCYGSSFQTCQHWRIHWLNGSEPDLLLWVINGGSGQQLVVGLAQSGLSSRKGRRKQRQRTHPNWEKTMF